MSKHIPLHLSAQEREHLENLIHSGDAPARTQTRARILLLSDRSQGHFRTHRQVAQVLLCSLGTIHGVRHRFLSEGLQAALYDKPRPGARPKITGDIEAQLSVVACSDPPEGCARWTLRLLAERLVELQLLDSISHVAVWERLKKTKSSPGE